jgi:hypothetical protein
METSSPLVFPPVMQKQIQSAQAEFIYNTNEKLFSRSDIHRYRGQRAALSNLISNVQIL